MGDSTLVAFDILTKDNYKTWRMQAEALLRIDELWDYIEEEEIISEDVDKRESWMKKDKIARSKLILHISSPLLPLVENCTTSREVWLKLADVYDNKDDKPEDSTEKSDTDDEDAIINDIEDSVDDFFTEIITDSSEKNITEEDKKSLSKKFADNLFSRLKESGITKLPDEKIVVDAITAFIDVINKLPKTEIEERKNELSGELIDILLVEFNINPHKNENDETTENNADETKSNAEEAKTQDEDLDGAKREESNKDLLNELMSSVFRRLTENQIKTTETFLDKKFDKYQEVLQFKQEFDDQNSYDQFYSQELGLKNSMNPLSNLYTPPPSPSPQKTYRCGVCRKEGHNRTTCPLNKSIPSAFKSPDTIVTTPKRSPIESVAKAAPRSTIKTLETPKRSPKCGLCGVEGHNRTTCVLNRSSSSASKSFDTIVATPKRSPPKCGICGVEGHNRTTCSMNKPAIPVSKATAPKLSETPKRLYACGGCGKEGHNITSCPWLKSQLSSSRSAAASTPARSYKCGSCGGEGHNTSTCPRNSITPSASPRAANKCGTCGGEGHNSRTCDRRESSSPSYAYTPVLSYSTPSPSSTGGSGRSYSCGTCGGSGHNSRTCGRRESSSPSYAYTPVLSYPSYSSYSSYSTPAQSYSSPSPSYSGGSGRSYSCGRCGGSGHNRRTCSG